MVKKPLDRYTEAEHEVLFSLVREKVDTPADELAALFVRSFPKRGLDAVKQRIFKIRREGNVNEKIDRAATTTVATANSAVQSNGNVAPSRPAPRDLMILELESGARLRGTPEQVLTVLKGLQSAPK